MHKYLENYISQYIWRFLKVLPTCYNDLSWRLFKLKTSAVLVSLPMIHEKRLSPPWCCWNWLRHHKKKIKTRDPIWGKYMCFWHVFTSVLPPICMHLWSMLGFFYVLFYDTCQCRTHFGPRDDVSLFLIYK